MIKKLLGGQETAVRVDCALILAVIAAIVIVVYTFVPKDLLYLP